MLNPSYGVPDGAAVNGAQSISQHVALHTTHLDSLAQQSEFAMELQKEEVATLTPHSVGNKVGDQDGTSLGDVVGIELVGFTEG